MRPSSWSSLPPAQRNHEGGGRASDWGLPRGWRPGASRSAAAGLEIDVEAERLQLLDQDVEALRNARLEIVLVADDGLVDLRAAGHVVGLHRQHLLQGIGGAIGLQ